MDPESREAVVNQRPHSPLLCSIVFHFLAFSFLLLFIGFARLSVIESGHSWEGEPPWEGYVSSVLFRHLRMHV